MAYRLSPGDHNLLADAAAALNDVRALLGVRGGDPDPENLPDADALAAVGDILAALNDDIALAQHVHSAEDKEISRAQDLKDSAAALPEEPTGDGARRVVDSDIRRGIRQGRMEWQTGPDGQVQLRATKAMAQNPLPPI